MSFNHHKIVAIVSLCLGFALTLGCGDPAPVVDIDAEDGSTELVSEESEDTASPDVDAPAEASENTIEDIAKTKSSTPGMKGMGKMKFPAPEDMKFKDNVESNVELPKDPSDLVFINRDGSDIKLASYIGKKNVILVFTEGFNGMICPFCQTQTSRLVANYKKFQDRDCEVIVVYPGPSDHLDEFVEAALKTEKDQLDRVPFPIVLDPEFTATNYFDIHSKHAHPSTYLIDKNGGVQLAYVGSDMTADRPSVSALIKKLDELK